jgi:hypothetical protein
LDPLLDLLHIPLVKVLFLIKLQELPLHLAPHAPAPGRVSIGSDLVLVLSLALPLWRHLLLLILATHGLFTLLLLPLPQPDLLRYHCHPHLLNHRECRRRLLLVLQLPNRRQGTRTGQDVLFRGKLGRGHY